MQLPFQRDETRRALRINKVAGNGKLMHGQDPLGGPLYSLLATGAPAGQYYALLAGCSPGESPRR